MKFGDAHEAAVEYRRRGFEFVPGAPRGEKGTREPNWWSRTFTESDIDPAGNINLKTGAPSGNLIDVDLDCEEARTLAPIWLPPTQMRHGREGDLASHYWYLAEKPPLPPSAAYAMPQSLESDRRTATLIELRADKRLTGVPPSVYADGGRLVFFEMGRPATVDVTVLHAAVTRIASAVLLSRFWLAGSRHNATLPLAGYLLRRWPLDRVVDFLDGMALVAGADRSKVVSDVHGTAKRLATGLPVSGGHQLHEFFPETALSTAFKWLGLDSEPPRQWPEPILFGTPNQLPCFPLETLPAPIRRFVEQVSAAVQVPADLPAMLSLGALAAAAGGRFFVEAKEGYREPLNLFIAPTAQSGERKSATMRMCLRPLEEEERRLIEEWKPRFAAAKEQRSLEDARLENLRRQAAKNGAVITPEIQQLAVNRTEIPPAPKLLVGDVTPEQLSTLLAEQSGRIAVADAESGGIFEIMAGRYSRNGTPNFDVFLRGHAGDHHRVDRRDRSETIPHVALTMILAPQPVVLGRLATDPQFRGRGLLARFLYAFPESLVGNRAFTDAVVGADVSAAYNGVLTSILSVGPPTDSGPGKKLILSSEGLEIWKDFYNKNESRQAPGGDLHRIRDWASKAAGAAIRIAGLIHLADGHREDVPIGAETIAAGWAIVDDYLVPHALEAFALMETDRSVATARKIANWILKTQRHRVTLRDAHKNFPAFGEPSEFRAPFGILVERSIVAEEPPDARSGPGRPRSPSYEVNPLFLQSANSAKPCTPPPAWESADFADADDDGEETDSADSADPCGPGPA